MAQKTLNAYVTIGGKVDSSFGQIGTALVNLGNQVNEISEKLMNFGKESVNVYKNYNYSMTQLETIWGTNGKFEKDSNELKTAMDEMNSAASEWAANSIFHTNDIANAMVEAARASWDLDQMLEGIPVAMRMAQAGGMDLSTGLNYVLKVAKDFKLDFKDLASFTDMWIYAANRSAGTAQEFGDTFLRMGSTVQFAADPAEVLALTAAMHNMGATGSEAGTLLRNSLLRVLAPASDKAEIALKSLGITVSEVREQEEELQKEGFKALSDDDLALMGLNPFDEMGQAKPILQIYAEMGDALARIAGGYENINRNEAALRILQSVFGQRAITGATNIIAMLEESKTLYDELTGGAAEGTGEYVAEGMMATLYGSEELLKSKAEELQRRVGEELSGPLQEAYGFLGNVTDMLSGLDSTAFSALVSGLTTVAFAGPGLTLAGGALRVIGNLLTPAGAIGIGAVALAGFVSSMNTLKETNWVNSFGTMGLDENGIGQYIKTLGEDFNKAFSNVDSFRKALEDSVTQYQTASSTFSGELLTTALTGMKLEESDLQYLEGLGHDMYMRVLQGIKISGDTATAFWQMLYGGEGVAETDPMYQDIVGLLQTEAEQMTAEADRINQKIHDALMGAYEKGLTEEDYQQILEYMREYNRLVARASREAENEDMFVQQQKLLRKAQNAGYEGTREISDTARAQRDADLAKLEDEYLTEYFGLVYDIENTEMTPEQRAHYDEMLADTDRWYEKNRAKVRSNYDQLQMQLWENLALGGDDTGALQMVENMAEAYLNGMLSPETAEAMITEALGSSQFAGGGHWDQLWSANERDNLARTLGNMIDSLGGVEAVAGSIQQYREIGNNEMARKMLSMLAMEQLVTNFSDVTRTEGYGWDFLNFFGNFQTVRGPAEYARNLETVNELAAGRAATLAGARQTIDALGGIGGTGSFIEAIGNYLTLGTGMNQIHELSGGARDALGDIVDSLAGKYDLEAVYSDMMAGNAQLTEGNAYRDYIAMYGLLYGEQGRTAEQYLRPEEPAEISVEFPDAEKNAGSTRKAIEGVFENPIEQEIRVSYRLGAIIGSGLGESGGDTGIGELNIPQEASGGRETVPSIFAEAGIPEWYIPEEHTDNTGRLLLAAMSASGFDLIELAAMSGARMFAEGGTSGSGGLSWGSLGGSGSGSGSSGGSGSGISVQYSPVIHTDNAEGMQRALLEDKKRLEKWFSEFMERRDLYESMVTYA